MWFEILPSFGIITVLLSVPGYAIYGLHKATLGNAYRRKTEQRWHRMLYQRDRIVDADGNPYAVHGLEAIKD